jgi:Kdo2-lipid IVA lauroyltransferase/acyltransferase
MAGRRNRLSIGLFFYELRYRVGEYALRAFIRCLPRIPRWAPRLYVSIMSRLTFALLWKYRRRMEENITMALGQEVASQAERKRLAWRAWKNFALGVLDTSLAMHDSKAAFVAKINLTGEEHLQRALAKGKGVLALSAHLGGFTLIGGRLAAAGYPFSVVVKQPRNERFARVLDQYRAQLGIQTISAKPRREAVRGILKALRENRIVLVIADEFKSGDIMVEFFGQEFPAPRGPASLALRTGAATLPMFATRQADGSMLLAIDAAIEPVQKDSLEDSVIATTVVFSQRLEAEIRRYPDQWNWLGFPRRDGKISSAEVVRRAGLRPPMGKPGEVLNQKEKPPLANTIEPAKTR